MHPGSSGLQKENFTCMGMAVSLDFLSGDQVCGKKDQVGGTAIFRVNPSA